MRFSEVLACEDGCFLRMLFDEHELVYAWLGTCNVENRLFVGLAAETGERGDRGRELGDLSESDGRVGFCAAEMLKDSLGLAVERAAYMATTQVYSGLAIRG